MSEPNIILYIIDQDSALLTHSCVKLTQTFKVIKVTYLTALRNLGPLLLNVGLISLKYGETLADLQHNIKIQSGDEGKCREICIYRDMRD